MTIQNKESDFVTCRGPCKSIKVRILAGKFPKGAIKKYVDHMGKLWNGRVCPECNNERLKGVMQQKRANVV